MTLDKLHTGNTLRQQIAHIDVLLDEFKDKDYKMDPIIRNSGMYLKFGYDDKWIRLTEGEAVCIRDALKSYKAQLENEFGRL